MIDFGLAHRLDETRTEFVRTDRLTAPEVVDMWKIIQAIVVDSVLEEQSSMPSQQSGARDLQCFARRARG